MKMIKMGVGQKNDDRSAARSWIFNPARRMRLSKKSQLAKFGIDQEIQIGELGQEGGMANPGQVPLGRESIWESCGRMCSPVRGVKSAFQTIS